MKVGDYIVSKSAVYKCGKVIGIVTGFYQCEFETDPPMLKYSVLYSTTGEGFGLSLSDYKRRYKVIKDEQIPEIIRQWGSTTPVVGE